MEIPDFSHQNYERMVLISVPQYNKLVECDKKEDTLPAEDDDIVKQQKERAAAVVKQYQEEQKEGEAQEKQSEQRK